MESLSYLFPLHFTFSISSMDIKSNESDCSRVDTVCIINELRSIMFEVFSYDEFS